MKKLAVLIATGYEDVELILPLDIFKRKKIVYDLVSVENLTQVQGSNEAIVKTQKIKNLKPENYAGLMIPGGTKGVKRLSDSLIAKTWIQEFAKDQKILAAICAAPQLLYDLKLLKNKSFTAHPSLNLTESLDLKAIKDDNIITGKDYLSAFEFAHLILKTFQTS